MGPAEPSDGRLPVGPGEGALVSPFQRYIRAERRVGLCRKENIPSSPAFASAATTCVSSVVNTVSTCAALSPGRTPGTSVIRVCPLPRATDSRKPVGFWSTGGETKPGVERSGRTVCQPALLTSYLLRHRMHLNLQDLPRSGILDIRAVCLRCPRSLSPASPGTYGGSLRQLVRRAG